MFALAGYSGEESVAVCKSYKLKISQIDENCKNDVISDSELNNIPLSPPFILELSDDIYVKLNEHGDLEFDNNHQRQEIPENRKKIYIPVVINNFRTIALVDQGSDVTIICLSMYKGLRNKIPGTLRRSRVKSLTSFSGGQTHVFGK